MTKQIFTEKYVWKNYNTMVTKQISSIMSSKLIKSDGNDSGFDMACLLIWVWKELLSNSYQPSDEFFKEQ